MIGIAPEEARAREICARLIPHTTSIHNVVIIAALLAEHDRRVTELLAANTAEVERLLTELDEMRQRYRGNSYLAERVQWTADWLREKRAEWAQGESDGKSD